MSGWPNLSDLLVDTEAGAPVGLVGAPLDAGSVTPGRCDLAPAARCAQTLRRIGRYDVETGREISHSDRRSWRRGRSPGCPSNRRRRRSATRCKSSVARHALTLLVGGNNAVTRPGRARPRPAAGESRADHARCPFRHARHHRGPQQRQSGAGAARGWAAGREHRADRARPLRQQPKMHRDAVDGGQSRRRPSATCGSTESSARSSGAGACRALRRHRRRLRHRRDRSRADSRRPRALGRAEWQRTTFSRPCAASRAEPRCASSTSPNGTRRSIRPTSAR